MTVSQRMAERDPRLYFYDTIADRFDELVNAYDLRRRLEIVFGELLGADDLTGVSVLDVGCGSGWFSREAQRRGARVTSLDSLVPMYLPSRNTDTSSAISNSSFILCVM